MTIVRTLLSVRPELKIVLVDARSLCSGATGRNGGHYAALAEPTPSTRDLFNQSPLGLDYRCSYWLRYGAIIVSRANTGRRATAEDSETHLAPMAHLRGFGDEVVASAPVPGQSATYIQHAWSGILAFSQDGMPFAGRLLGRKHQWVCGGYHATGMVKAFRTAQFVAGLILGATVQESIGNYPRSMLLTEDRFRALRRSLDLGKAATVVLPKL